MATEITKKIEDFRAGKIDWLELRDWLVHRQHATPKRYLNTPKDIGEMQRHDANAPYDEDGTWDEVNRAHNIGLLTDDQYQEIVREAERAYPTG